MYVINKTKGIGEIISESENKVVVYFDEVDEEKTLIKDFVTIYKTLEEAENALNPEITEDQVTEILADIKRDKEESNEARKAAQWLEAHNIEVSKKLMSYI